MYKINGKKAQMAEGLTWVVATIAIIVILLFSIFITSDVFGFNSNEIAPKSFSSSLNHKSLLSYLLTKEPSGEMVYSKIKADENLNDFNGNLALKVFKGLYGHEYSGMWVGVSNPEALIAGRVGNKFFDRTSLVGTESYSLMIKFAKEKFVEAIFVK